MKYTTLFRLIKEVPDKTSNLAGKAAREALLEELKLALPGLPDGFLYCRHSYQQVFFSATLPKRKKSATVVTGISGVSAYWWQKWSASLLCQAIYYEVAPLGMNIDKINAQVDSYSAEFRSKAFVWYAYVLPQACPEIGRALACLPNFEEARLLYIAYLVDKNWIAAKNNAVAEGQWSNAGWEMFHHCIKLHLLGATADEITQVMQTLQDMGLKMPGVAWEFGDYWRYYYEWMQPNTIDWTDLVNEAFGGLHLQYPVMQCGGVVFRKYSKDFVEAFGKQFGATKRKEELPEFSFLEKNNQQVYLNNPDTFFDDPLMVLCLENLCQEMMTWVNSVGLNKEALKNFLEKVVKANFLPLLQKTSVRLCFDVPKTAGASDVSKLDEYFRGDKQNDCVAKLLDLILVNYYTELWWAVVLGSKRLNNGVLLANDCFIVFSFQDLVLRRDWFAKKLDVLEVELSQGRVSKKFKVIPANDQVTPRLLTKELSIKQDSYAHSECLTLEVIGYNQALGRRFNRKVTFPTSLIVDRRQEASFSLTNQSHSSTIATLGFDVCLRTQEKPISEAAPWRQPHSFKQEWYAGWLGQALGAELVNALKEQLESYRDYKSFD
ncbi:hypothetical protein [Microscilla marina]|uniref:Uncharacterized protein n=1 Tax=Microscilla marina ATCC 23134 TaxID=313606 RepID=A1ZUN9_MICM2|nr:hypothetical protein [Microscilla marina]EAY25925.1 hypothetical protein M23134_00879 [Microscilla marina ATCC 23134]